MDIYCCGCRKDVKVRLTDGIEIYPSRHDLAELPFWKCDTCGNFVGCHHKTKDRTKPLGCIPTPQIKNARKHIHELIDPIYRSGRMKRSELYAEISQRVGWNYHTADIRSVEDARIVYRAVLELKKEKGYVDFDSQSR